MIHVSTAPAGQLSLADDHPQLAALDIRIHHLLGVDTESLSFAQLEAVEEAHRSALLRIEQARLSLVRVQERARVREEDRLIRELSQL